ncbi:hypothetical protein EMCRGX_G011910 [Ephydatia muelleri]
MVVGLALVGAAVGLALAGAALLLMVGLALAGAALLLVVGLALAGAALLLVVGLALAGAALLLVVRLALAGAEVVMKEDVCASSTPLLQSHQKILSRLLQPSTIGKPLLSDTDCPMFELSRNIEAVEGCKVLKAVSFVHDCFSEGCHFEEMVTTVSIEREKVGVDKKQQVCK